MSDIEGDVLTAMHDESVVSDTRNSVAMRVTFWHKIYVVDSDVGK